MLLLSLQKLIPYSSRQLQWFPHALLHWRELLFKQTRRLLLFFPDVVGRDRTLSLVAMADSCTRAVLPKVPVAGNAMLTSYNEWIVDAIEAAETEQQEQQQQQQLTTATAGESHSLHAVCEYYLYRNDGIQRVNKNLVQHIGALERDLKQTQASLFQAQCIISRLKEVDDVRASRLRVTPRIFRALGQEDPRFAERTMTTTQVREDDKVGAQAQHSSHDVSDPVARVKAEDAAEDELCEDLKTGDVCILSDDEVPDSSSVINKTRRVDVDNRVLQGSPIGHPQTSEVDTLEMVAETTASSNFSQLLELNDSTAEEEDGEGSWHRRALRRLTHEREQRRSARSRSQSLSSAVEMDARSSFASSIEMESLPRSSINEEEAQDDTDHEDDDEEEPEAPLDFQSLVALRISLDDVCTIADWQQRALHCLSKERHRLRSASASPTSSTASSPTFLCDA